ncbi:MAG: TSUP family transporter, partial [Rhodanobacter sp.]
MPGPGPEHPAPHGLRGQQPGMGIAARGVAATSRPALVIYALFGALTVGLSLGLLGSGGSILTVPVLVYLLHQPPKQAIAGSLAIVGAIALVGAVRYASQ